MLAAALVLTAGLSAQGAVTMPKIFGDHMVLQQGMGIPVFGKADPGEEVTVTLGKDKAAAKADANGLWRVDLPKMKAPGEALTLSVSGKDTTLEFGDVLIGEVWVGSGQSNMQMTVKSTNNGEQEIAEANYPEIRLFSVERLVAGEPQEDCNGQWVVCTPESIPDFSAVAYYFGREIYKTIGVPIGLIHTSWGGTPAESWTSRETLLADPDLKVMVDRWDETLAKYPEAKAAFDKAAAEWQAAAAKAKTEGKEEPKKPDAPAGPDNPHRTSGLYNAMIVPVAPYGIRGAIWYQGESNAGRAYQYRKLFPAMIEDWRKLWGEGPFPFYFVQLANFTDQLPDPGDSDWAELREAQSMTLGLKNTGMAVIIDIGDAKDIHPRNKQDVGKRLAAIAIARDYGKKVPYSGPAFKEMEVEDGKIELEFEHTDGGLKAQGGDTLKGFAIAGEDKKFVWADAVIKEGDEVVVSSSQVAKPVAVRYGWANNPDCNLYNGAGFPASPFRTDDWPGITAGKN